MRLQKSLKKGRISYDAKTFSKPAIKWTVAAILCATLSAGALVNAVAATATADEVTASKTYVESSTEFEVGNGDVVVSTNKNFNMSFDVIKANKITIDNCGEKQTISLAKGTVKEVLDRTGITLTDNKSVTPSLNTVITDDTNIYVYNAKTLS